MPKSFSLPPLNKEEMGTEAGGINATETTTWREHEGYVKRGELWPPSLFD